MRHGRRTGYGRGKAASRYVKKYRRKHEEMGFEERRESRERARRS